MSDTGAILPSQLALAPESERKSRPWLTLLVILALAAGIGAWVSHALKVEPLPFAPHLARPQPLLNGNKLSLAIPGYSLGARIATYKDELFAYLMFDFLRHQPQWGDGRLLLAFDPRSSDAPYRLMWIAGDDLLSAHASITTLDVSDQVQLLPRSAVTAIQKQTELFDSAYNLPVRKKFEQLPKQAVAEYLKRFIRFKSVTDPRIRRNLQPVPVPISQNEAQQIAGDIMTVAEFFELPLEFFLAIGAVENNYMNVRGDLKHSIWKRRAAPDDVVLERRRGRVRVLNDSAGVWQITRQTLRYAHGLYKKDQRDYSVLPEHLQPPDKLYVDDIRASVLTTYAGLLLRDLLDRFDGDVTLAVSAYNGGPARPNLRYGEHVHRAAEHARRIAERAAALNGETVVNMTWLRRP